MPSIADSTVRLLETIGAEIASCRACPRLVRHREEVARVRKRAYRDQQYWGKPVPGFGDPAAGVLVLGLAPAAHGANRTGRMFTGDRSGLWLYRALHRAGLASQATSTDRGDGLVLRGAFVSAVCRCAPPDNRPTPTEIARCRPFVLRELDALQRLRVVLALGGIAFVAALEILAARGAAIPRPRPRFSHGAVVRLDGQPPIVASYHPSQQNTHTGRLTEKMLDDAVGTAARLARTR